MILMKCRLCGSRVWFFQKSVGWGTKVHRSCYFAMYQTVYVAFIKLADYQKLAEVLELLKKCWNTGEWLADDWRRGKLAMDVDAYEVRSNKANVRDGGKTHSTTDDGTLRLEKSDEERAKDFPGLDSYNWRPNIKLK